jgi:chromosome segregation ATPase
MTSLGKLLVLANTFVAIVLFGWAVSLYANRVDWFDRTTEDGKIEGQITQLQAEIKRQSEVAKGMQASYARTAQQTVFAEQSRDYRKFKFDEQINDIRRVDDKVKFLEQTRLPGTVLINLDAPGPTIKGLNGKDLMGLGALRKKFDTLTENSSQIQNTLVKLRGDYSALSDTVDTVQAEVLRQKIIAGNLKDEQEYLFDARINWEEQLRILEARKAQLEERLAKAKKK